MASSSVSTSSTIRAGCDTATREEVTVALQQFGGEARPHAALARRQRDDAEARLAAKRLDQPGEGVFRFAHVGGVDLARVAREDVLGALADARQHGLQRRRFEVL